MEKTKSIKGSREDIVKN